MNLIDYLYKCNLESVWAYAKTSGGKYGFGQDFQSKWNMVIKSNGWITSHNFIGHSETPALSCTFPEDINVKEKTTLCVESPCAPKGPQNR